jgi:chromosome segregation protein
MKIKKIELLGFKSFSDKIAIDFPHGVTAVVGPNGCGKSNVVDAIRWALGEQSPKQLRGKAMEDVIFNGSETKKPQGLAEVILTFSNENGHALPAYIDFSEISVGRRLFRSGESEYFINKVPCRLKDVTDLFLGTGVGHRAYSIVEQGKMDFVLNAKPEERRILIEEAAGITKYKDRKAAALRKMEATQQNLLRLSDVIGEIKRQMNSLNRQAKKAERYKAYREELRSLELGQAAQTCRSLESERSGLQTSLQELQDLELQATAEIREVEAAMEQIKVNLLDLERDLTLHQERFAENEGTIKNRETEIEFASRDRETLQKQVLRAEEEIGKWTQQQETADQEVRSFETEAADLHQRITADAELLTGKEKILQEKKALHAIAEQALADEKNDLVDLLTQIARLKNSLVDAHRRTEELAHRQQRLAREKEEAQEKGEEIHARLTNQARQLDGRRQSRLQIEAEWEQKTLHLKELHVALAHLEEKLTRCREKLNQESSRLESLLELQRNFEGYQAGVRSILLKRQTQGVTQNGIYGLVEDFIETDPQYEAVVESVLGERLQHFIVQNHEESLKAIDYLKSQRSGRSSFIPLQLKPHPALGGSTPPAEGVIPLLEVVKVKEDFAHLALYLFGDVWVVPDLRQAIDLWNRNSIWKTLVTLDGEVLHPSGVVTGGSKEQIGSGTFHRKREIRDLTQSTAEFREQLHSLESTKEKLLAEVKTLEGAIEGLIRTLHLEDLQIVAEEKEIDQYQMEENRWRQKIEALQFEESQLAEDLMVIQNEAREGEANLQAAELTKTGKEQALRHQGEDLHLLKTDIETLMGEVTEAKVRLGSLQEKRQSLVQNLERSRRITLETTSQLVQRRQEVQENLEMIKSAEEKQKTAEMEIQRLLLQHQELLTQVEAKKEALLSAREKLAQVEGKGKERRQALNQLHEQKNSLTMKSMELDLNRKHLLSSMEEKYRIPMENLLSRDDSQDYFAPEIEARLGELKGLIEGMGEVNLLAIQEYEEAKTRLEFLTSQEADLVQSLESLNQAIKKINRTSRKRFAETYEAVNSKFKEVFSTLFNGGRAELILLDESNLLETGVDIVAQPPGKRLQNITLLSGGEKALTAVALIISLYLINPSPFCLMDEVDAPLDDANVGRFNRLVKELAAKYQIILVTHNKSTMELADTLYGVTMEEPGVSRIVSVHLN